MKKIIGLFLLIPLLVFVSGAFSIFWFNPEYGGRVILKFFTYKGERESQRF